MDTQFKYTHYTDFYISGGSLNSDSLSYIERKADIQLFEKILAREFCYILTPRQMGKSSLMARTAFRLQKIGIRTVTVDLSAMGGNKDIDPDQWYCGVIDEIISQLKMNIDLCMWWEKRKYLPPVKRLMDFFKEVMIILSKDDNSLVIFIDEIDTTLNLQFTDDFFATVRACYNARATKSEYRKLTFVLLGVASPSDLIKDVKRTPFNIGTRIELEDFTLEEAAPLSCCLGSNSIQNKKALNRILYWTGGHPYLTQKMCRLVAQQETLEYIDDDIDKIVRMYFIDPGAASSENNIQFVITRLLGNKKRNRALLLLYQRICNDKLIEDNPLSYLHYQLKLSGLVAKFRERKLGVRNKIYKEVFNSRWIKENIPIPWNLIIATIVFFISTIFILYLYFGVYPKKYIKLIQLAEDHVPSNEFEKLNNIPFYDNISKRVISNFWDRFALKQELRIAILYKLNALCLNDNIERRQGIQFLIEEIYGKKNSIFNNDIDVQYTGFFRLNEFGFSMFSDRNAIYLKMDSGKTINKQLLESGYGNVSFSTDGNLIIICFREKAIIWNRRIRNIETSYSWRNNIILSASFSPDGNSIILGFLDGTVWLWEWKTNKFVKKIMKSKDSVFTTTFSPNGENILIGDRNGKIIVWDLKKEKIIRNFFYSHSSVNAASFSPDGNYLAIGYDDGAVHFLDWKTGKLMRKPLLYNSGILALQFTSNGNKLFVETKSEIFYWTFFKNKNVFIQRYSFPVRFIRGIGIINSTLNVVLLPFCYKNNSILFSEINLNKINCYKLIGDPKQLLKEWQIKLGLELNPRTGAITKKKW